MTILDRWIHLLAKRANYNYLYNDECLINCQLVTHYYEYYKKMKQMVSTERCMLLKN